MPSSYSVKLGITTPNTRRAIITRMKLPAMTLVMTGSVFCSSAKPLEAFIWIKQYATTGEERIKMRAIAAQKAHTSHHTFTHHVKDSTYQIVLLFVGVDAELRPPLLRDHLLTAGSAIVALIVATAASASASAKEARREVMEVAASNSGSDTTGRWRSESRGRNCG